MPLHPLSRTMLDEFSRLKPLEEVGVEEGRRQMVELARMLPPGPSVAHVEDRFLPGEAGDIPIRVYYPGAHGPFPILVFFHGGGWVLGNLDSSDAVCRVLANAARCLVVSVNYRHGPEHKFPAAPHDAYAATEWISRNARTFEGDPARLAVGGGSAGGNLAAVTALMARDRGAPDIRFQLLIVPVTNYAFDTASYEENAEGYGLTRSTMRWFWKHYLNSETDGANPYASPLRAPSLGGLAPAFVLTAEYDPLRDEGASYAQRLREAGVPVIYKSYAGMTHMLLGPEADTDMARELREKLR
jgi:acetyl esterase